ncbi:MAG: methionyl-tRNA formyltransferase [Arenicellales bacterium]
MRIVFAGTPDFAVPTLKALAGAGHAIEAVLTQPDRPAGRGRHVAAGPVKRTARELGLDVFQPKNLKSSSVLADIRVLQPQVIVVVAYGLLLTREVLELPDYGCINVHASLLPRWRGAAPIQRAIEAGDAQTGVTVMRMDEGLDTGPVLARCSTPIGPRETAGTLHDRLAGLGATLLVETLVRVEAGAVEAVPQDESSATYAHKLGPSDVQPDWRRRAVEIERQVRAMNPWPVVRARYKGQVIRFWEAEALAGGSGLPGEIIGTGRTGVDVACGEGRLRITMLQREGGKRLAAADFLNGCPLESGERFDSAAA